MLYNNYNIPKPVILVIFNRFYSDSFLIWSNPVIYEAAVTPYVAASFGAIFTTKLVANLYLQGQLSRMAEQPTKVVINSMGPAALMYSVMWLTHMPGISQAVFLTASLANQVSLFFFCIFVINFL